jgi:hypothetical protein
MNATQRTEYCEAVGLHLLFDIAPLTVDEYRMLARAVALVERQRLVDAGMDDEDAAGMLALMDDYFAFDTAVLGSADPE